MRSLPTFGRKVFSITRSSTHYFSRACGRQKRGLRWGDVDLCAVFLSITKSRYKDKEGAPKTVGSERELKLLLAVVAVLKQIKPVHTVAVESDIRVF